MTDRTDLLISLDKARSHVRTSLPSRSINDDLGSLYRIAMGQRVPDKCPSLFSSLYSSKRGLYKVTEKYNLNKNDIQNDAIRTYIRIAESL